jgi:cell division protein FtsZ
MSNNLPIPPQPAPVPKIFGVGNTGLGVLEVLIADGLSPATCVGIDAGGQALENTSAAQKLRLENQRMRGLGFGGDPERAHQAAEQKSAEIKALCHGTDVVFILAGLGGGSGTGISPVLGRLAKESGALVIAFVTIPFECEGTRRQSLALEGLEELKAAADGVICLPNQKIFKLIQENTTVVDTFRITNRLLAECVYGLWRLLSCKGLIEIPLEDICRVLQDRHSESTFAVAEASGESRSSLVIEKIFAHPTLEDNETFSDSETVLVSISGGPDLSMTEVNYVMEQIKARCESARFMLGASVDERFERRLAVTVIASRKPGHEVTTRPCSEELDTQLLDRDATAKPNSRFLPPPPVLRPGQVQQLLSNQGRNRSTSRKTSAKLRQGQLPLEIVSKGRFDKSEPTIHKGEDLDVPTYIRRGVSLN